MDKDKIVLFYPYIPEKARDRARATLDTRWIGQGPQVDEFEKLFQTQLSHEHKAIAVNSGTSALHLSYILAGIKDGDEVIAPVFSCSATHTPLLYQRAKIKFADIQKDTLNIDPSSVEKLMNPKVKAIIGVHYGGLPCDLDELQAIASKWGVPLIEDAAQAIGASYKDKMIGSISDFTAFSFQGVKILTTTDGGMMTIKDSLLEEKAKRIRWFGIDRKAKFEDRWKKDITEVGYKYQMTDVEASLGIEGMNVLNETMKHYRDMFNQYKEGLNNIPGITFIGEKEDRKSSCWLATTIVEKRDELKKKLAENNIESDQVHYRCDRYTVFGGAVDNCPNMDYLEDKYLVLPMHYHMTKDLIDRVISVIRGGW